MPTQRTTTTTMRHSDPVEGGAGSAAEGDAELPHHGWDLLLLAMDGSIRRRGVDDWDPCVNELERGELDMKMEI